MTSTYQRTVRGLGGCADEPDRLLELALELVSTAGAVAAEARNVDTKFNGGVTPEHRSRLLESLGDVIWAAVALIDACGGDEQAVRQASAANKARQLIERGRLTPEEAEGILRLLKKD